MFGIKVQGRLGNQLFQYAFALAQKKRLQKKFYLHKIYRIRIVQYFNIPESNYFFHYLQRGYFLLVNKFKPVVIVQDQAEEPEKTLALFAKDNILIDGFFQSEQYFKNVTEDINTQLTVKEKFKTSIADFTKNTKENIVVHIRRTDYINWGNDVLGYNLALPKSYYHNALLQIDTQNKNVIFISDDIGFTKENFNIPGTIYSENNTEIFDLQLLMNADYLIISNSTFAWWGAYLNKNVKAVYSPQYWLGFKINKEWPAGITLNNWKQVNVSN